MIHIHSSNHNMLFFLPAKCKYQIYYNHSFLQAALKRPEVTLTSFPNFPEVLGRQVVQQHG